MRPEAQTSGTGAVTRTPGSARDVVREHQTVAFFAGTLLLSWTAWLVAYAATDGSMSQLYLIPGAFGPMVAAALVTRVSGGSVRTWAAGLVDWRVRPRWYLLALALPLLLVVGSVGTTLVLAGAPLEPSRLVGRLPVYPLVLGFVFLVGGGQEEFGWRGFALPRLQRTYGALVASLVVGGVWAVWHLPLFFVGLARNASGDFLLYAVLVLGVSVLLTWCYNSTGGGLLVAMLFHAGVNAAGGLVPAGEAVVERSPVLVDAGMTVGVWLAAVVVVVLRGPATLSDRPLPGRERTSDPMDATRPQD